MLNKGGTIWRSADLMGNKVKHQRLPQQIQHVAWNQKFSLVAFAAQNGDISVKRPNMKLCWKRNVCDERSVLLDEAKVRSDAQLYAICWSPSGKVLAAALRNGILFLLDTEKGLVRFTTKLCCNVRSICWQKLSKSNVDMMSEFSTDTFQSTESCVRITEKDSSSDRASTTSETKLTKEFCSENFLTGIMDTIILVITADNEVIILAGGILPTLRIEPPAKHFVNSDPYSIVLHDVEYSDVDNCLYAAYSCVCQAPESETSAGYMTQVISYDLDKHKYFEDNTIWRLAHRWIHIYLLLTYLFETLSSMIGDWKDLDMMLNEAFEPISKSCKSSLSDELICVLLSGYISKSSVRFIEDGLKKSEWKEICEVIFKGYGQLIDLINCSFSFGAKMLNFHIGQFINELVCSFERRKRYSILPSRVYDVDVYPYGKFVDDEELRVDTELNQLKSFGELTTIKTAEFEIIAVDSRKQLSNFIRWCNSLVLTSVGKDPKPSNTDDNDTSYRYNVEAVYNFILYTFGPSSLLKKFEQEQKGKASDVGKIIAKEQVISTVPIECRKEVQSYNFDKLKQFLGTESNDKLVYRSDLKHNGWSAPELEEHNSMEYSSMTLAQSLKKCLNAFDNVKEYVMKRFADNFEVISNANIVRFSTDPFEKICLFPSRNEKFQSSVSVSCIYSGGYRHCIYTITGKLVSDVHYSHKRNDTDFKLNVECESGVAGTSQPLKVDVSSSTLPISSTDWNYRIQDFVWYGQGVYYGVVCIKKRKREFMRMMRGSLYHKIIEVNEDASHMEPVGIVCVSADSKMGLNVSLCRTSVIVFEIENVVPVCDDQVMLEESVEDREDLQYIPGIRPEILALINHGRNAFNEKNMEIDSVSKS